MMTITTDKGTKIKVTKTPQWNEFHQRYYAPGFRWIETKQKFSTNCLLHNFKNYEPNTVEDMLA